MRLTAGSNHGASLMDSDLFVGLTRDLLQRGCNVRFRANGTSMHPTIRDGEVVTVAPLSGDSFAVGDVLLCRLGRRPTAHRVVTVQSADDGRPVLHLQGDNLYSPDRPVRAEDVIGRVLTVNRDGRDQQLDSPGRLVRLRRISRWLFAAAVVWADSPSTARVSRSHALIGTSIAHRIARESGAVGATKYRRSAQALTLRLKLMPRPAACKGY
jgi:Peptidase S24-like